MKIPKKITINAIPIDVKIVNCRQIDGPGEYNQYHKLIRIRKDDDVSEAVRAETFLHEIFEAIDKDNNLGLGHTTLTVLCSNLFATIRNNKLDFLDRRES